LQGLKYNYEKIQGCFCKIPRCRRFLGFTNLFSLREIRRIFPWDCEPGPPASAHESTGFIKRRLLATGSMARVKPSELLSQSFITDQTVGVAGSGQGRRGLALTVAHHGRARRLIGVQVFLSHGGQFPMRFAPTGSQR
jgi:hypothetical protein